MTWSRASEAFRRADEGELALCLSVISWCERRQLTAFFRVISRLGDGMFWYALMGLIALHDLLTGLQLALTGLACTTIYKSLKHALTRERPFITHSAINSLAPVLDRYSFPSGHTLHAVCFNVLLFGTYPALALVVLPFTLLVALSRVVLGLHYPSDVLAGALIGVSIASLSLTFWPLSA